MPLESCMILLDRSQFMRNGDYIPTRLEAQTDAANLLVTAKTQSHPESTVGVSAGTELLVSPTEDVGKILTALHQLPLQQSTNSSTTTAVDDITAAVQVASLALKHRRNKNGSQKIVLFVGSPLLNVDARAMQKAGRQLKKNNVSIDVVAMGELEVNEEKLRELVDAANGPHNEEERTCHLVTVPPGVLLSDVLLSSPILAGSGGAFAASAAAGAFGDGGGGGANNNFGEYGGVDPNMDPELAMALRISMEEERVRQESLAAAAPAADAAVAESKSGDEEMTDATAPSAADLVLSEEDALLQQALAMSMNENEPAEDSKPAAAVDDVHMEEDDDDDAAMQMALQMSMQADNNPEETAAQFNDPAFVNELLGTSGVDPNDPAIQEALRKALAKRNAEKKDDDDDSKK
jgi:26S proteasome regulatory subunit N10